MSIQQKTGNYGESKAIEYLEANDYLVIFRNFRYKRGEIDIIARKGELLVFVEVKTRRSEAYGFPEESIDDKKIEMIRATAEGYCEANKWLGPIQFDIISIISNKQTFELEHFEDAF